MNSELNVAVCQMTSIDSVEANFNQIQKLISSVPVDKNVELFCFPENALYMRLVEGEKVPALKLSDDVFSKLRNLAKERKAALHIGASPIEVDGQVFNGTVFIQPDGTLSSPYQKMHLFDIQLQGQKAIRESDVFKHGPKPEVVEYLGWKIGQSICYDLRFAELYSQYAKAEVDLILVPSAFLPKTGEAHWEVLLRARAIESQAYVVASAQGGVHRNEKGASRETYGHSLVVDPWGKILTQMGTQIGVEIHTLTKQRIAEVRQQIPMKSHRRGTLA
jgi:predicted amidohydrolase